VHIYTPTPTNIFQKKIQEADTGNKEKIVENRSFLTGKKKKILGHINVNVNMSEHDTW